MALLVCYSRSAPDDHVSDKAIYLDQKFYELIFHECMAERSHFANLSVIASLRYKSPILVVEGSNLDTLDAELSMLEHAGHKHKQLTKFRDVCAKAKADNCNLSISGDMYPEL